MTIVRLRIRSLTKRNILICFTERVALRWIQKYIDAFGGDPDRVTMYVEW